MSDKIKKQIFKKWQTKGIYLDGDVAILLKQLLPPISRFLNPNNPNKILWNWQRKQLEDNLIVEFYEYNS